MESLISLAINKSKNKWVSLLIFTFSLAAISGVHKLGMVSDYRIFFDENNVELQTFTSLQDMYNNSDNVFLLIRPSSGDIYNPETMTLIYELTELAWTLPHSSRVNSITNYQHIVGDGDDIIVEDFLAKKEDINSDRLQFIRDRAPAEVDLLNQLITKSGAETGINISFQMPGTNVKKEIATVASSVRLIVSEIQSRYPDHKIYTSGIVMMNNAFFEIAKDDFTKLIPLMVLVILIAAGLILRSFSGTIVITAVVLLSILTSLGLAGWLGIKLSPPSISAPIILLTIVIASTIHILSYIQRSAASGLSVDSALKHSFNKNIVPVTLTHATTMIGFLTMNFSESPPFRDLGNIVALGVAMSWLLSISLLPFLVRLLPMSKKTSVADKVFSKMGGVSDLVVNRRKVILFFVLPCFIAISAFSVTCELNDDLVEYFSKTVDFRKQTEVVNESFSGIYSIEYSIDTGKDNGIFEIEVLQFADEFAMWLRQQSDVMAVTSVTDFLKNINKSMNGGNASYYSLPTNKELAAQYFLLYEMSLPFGMDMNDRVNGGKSAMRTIVRLNNMDSNMMLLLEAKADAWLKENKLNQISIKYSSPTVMFAHIGKRNITSLLVGSVGALVLICFFMALLFQSFKVGVISVLTNFLPICFAYGIWALLVGEISLGLASVSAMTIGIVVDDTVHFLYGYIRHLREGKFPQQACRNTFREVGSAMLVSSIILAAGFFILATSSFEKNALMGLLTGITIVMALVCDLLLLPNLLITFLPKVRAKEAKSVQTKLVGEFTRV